MLLNFYCELLDRFEFGNELPMQRPADQTFQGSTSTTKMKIITPSVIADGRTS